MKVPGRPGVVDDRTGSGGSEVKFRRSLLPGASSFLAWPDASRGCGEPLSGVLSQLHLGTAATTSGQFLDRRSGEAPHLPPRAAGDDYARKFAGVGLADDRH